MDTWRYSDPGSKSLRQTLDDICDDFEDYDSDDLMKNDSLQPNAPKNVTQSTSSVNEDTYISTESMNDHNLPLFNNKHRLNGAPIEDDEPIETLSDHSSTAFSLSDIFLDSETIAPPTTFTTSSDKSHNYRGNSENLPKNIVLLSYNSRSPAMEKDMTSHYQGRTANTKQVLSAQTTSCLGKALRLKPLNDNVDENDNHKELLQKNLPISTEVELPKHLHTYTVLKDMHQKKEAELQQRLDESKAREEQYQQKIKSLESSQALSRKELDIVHNMTGEHDNTQQRNKLLTKASVQGLHSVCVNDDNRILNGMETVEKRHQVELENMRIVAEQVQADADRRIAEVERDLTEIRKRCNDMQQTYSSVENLTLWRQRLEYLVEKLCFLHMQGIRITMNESKDSFENMILEALRLGGDNFSEDILDDDTWKEWISILSTSSTNPTGKEMFTRLKQMSSDETECTNTLFIQIEQMKNAHARVVQENASLRLAKEATEEENLRVVQRGIELEQVAEDAMKECESLNKALITVQSELKEERNIQGQLRTEFAHLQNEASAAHDLIIKLKEDLATHQSHIKSLSDLQTKSEQHLCSLQSEQSSLQATLSNALAQLDEKEKLITETQRCKAESEDELLCQKNLNTLMKRKLEGHESEISVLREKASALSREKDSIERILENVRTDNISLSHKRTDVELECSRLRKEIDEKCGTIEFYTKEMTAMRKEMFEVESERIRFSQLWEVVQKEKIDLTQQLEDKKLAIIDLSAELSKLNGQLQIQQSQASTMDENQRILSSEIDYVNTLIASALNETSELTLKDSVQTILHRLESLTSYKERLDEEICRIQKSYHDEKLELVATNASLCAEQESIRNFFTLEIKRIEEEYLKEKKELIERNNQLQGQSDRLLLDINDRDLTSRRLKNECEQLMNTLAHEKEASKVLHDELRRECNQLREDLVHLEKKKAAFLTEVQRITSPLISARVPSKASPFDNIAINGIGLKKTPLVTELQSSLPGTSSTIVDPHVTLVNNTQRNSLSTIKHSLFSLQNDASSVLESKNRDDAPLVSDMTSKTNIETKLLSLNSISQRATDAMKSLKSMTRDQITNSVVSPHLSSNHSPTLATLFMK